MLSGGRERSHLDSEDRICKLGRNKKDQWGWDADTNREERGCTRGISERCHRP